MSPAAVKEVGLATALRDHYFGARPWCVAQRYGDKID